MVDGFNPPGVWSPFGTFSMAVIQGGGQIVHLKGQVSLDRDGRIVGPGDMRPRSAGRWRTSRRSWPASAAGWATSSR